MLNNSFMNLRYAIMENMRYFLSAYNTSYPTWFGYKFQAIVKQGYFSGGAGIFKIWSCNNFLKFKLYFFKIPLIKSDFKGYILSKEALRRFAEIGLVNYYFNYLLNPFI